MQTPEANLKDKNSGFIEDTSIDDVVDNNFGGGIDDQANYSEDISSATSGGQFVTNIKSEEDQPYR